MNEKKHICEFEAFEDLNLVFCVFCGDKPKYRGDVA